MKMAVTPASLMLLFSASTCASFRMDHAWAGRPGHASASAWGQSRGMGSRLS